MMMRDDKFTLRVASIPALREESEYQLHQVVYAKLSDAVPPYYRLTTSPQWPRDGLRAQGRHVAHCVLFYAKFMTQ